jgi:hypothetical protein
MAITHQSKEEGGRMKEESINSKRHKPRKGFQNLDSGAATAVLAGADPSKARRWQSAV